jgi:hypothetical protein
MADDQQWSIMPWKACAAPEVSRAEGVIPVHWVWFGT